MKKQDPILYDKQIPFFSSFFLTVLLATIAIPDHYLKKIGITKQFLMPLTAEAALQQNRGRFAQVQSSNDLGSSLSFDSMGHFTSPTAGDRTGRADTAERKVSICFGPIAQRFTPTQHGRRRRSREEY
jgi:hypothetical protein